jgi:hypothetical protein
MSKLTSGEQAKLEHALALAHRHIWQAMLLYQATDAYDQADDLMGIQQFLGVLLDDELRKGKGLRSRPYRRAYLYDSPLDDGRPESRRQHAQDSLHLERGQ